MNPRFVYPDPTIDAAKLAYDLSIIYARAKFEEALRKDPENTFPEWPASSDIEQQEFIYEKFLQAYEYYMRTCPGELERAFEDAAK